MGVGESRPDHREVKQPPLSRQGLPLDPGWAPAVDTSQREARHFAAAKDARPLGAHVSPPSTCFCPARAPPRWSTSTLPVGLGFRYHMSSCRWLCQPPRLSVGWSLQSSLATWEDLPRTSGIKLTRGAACSPGKCPWPPGQTRARITPRPTGRSTQCPEPAEAGPGKAQARTRTSILKEDSCSTGAPGRHTLGEGSARAF